MAGVRRRLRGLGILIALLIPAATFLPATVLAASVPKFTTQPGGAVAGTPFATQPVVKILSDGDVDPSAEGKITLSIKAGSGAPGAQLTCDNGPTKNVNDGVADFKNKDCEIDLPGTGYVLRATWSEGGFDDSVPFDVGAAGGTKLGFATQPARGIPGIPFAAQPVVAIQGAGGQTVTSSTATVTLAIAANPGGGTLTCSGGLSKAAVNGLAVFSGCTINAVGVGYTLSATSPGLTSATSNQFDVADRLVFTTQPAGATGGVAFTTQPVLAVRAGSQNTAVHDDVTQVTLAIQAGTGSPGAVLTCSGGLTRTVNDGVATFSGCAIDKSSLTSPSNPYLLVATASGLSTATSNPLVVAVGQATELGFAVSPTNSVATQPFPTQPVIAIQDAGGNVVTTGNASTKTITLAIDTNPGGGKLSCAGGLSKAAVAGLAAFTGCSIDKPGTGYKLKATSSGLASATSAAFNVASAAAITISPSQTLLTWGGSLLLSVHFAGAGAGRIVQLEAARDGVTWVTVATLSTDQNKNASFLYRPVTSLHYRVVFAGAPDLPALTSATTRVLVRQVAILRPTNLGVVKPVARGASVVFVTTVRPSRPELPLPRVTFVFYRRVSGVWLLVATRDVTANVVGQAITTWRFSVAGDWYVRAVANPTPFNANSVWSPVERYRVG